MGDESAAEMTISRCKLCLEDSNRRRFEASQWHVDTDTDYLDVLSHVVEEHPESAAVGELFDGVDHLTPCEECGATFASAIRVGPAGLTVQAYCDACIAQKPLRQLIVRSLAPADVFEEVPIHGE